MRFDIDTYREIADSLLRNRRRSILTGFGVFWGVFMLLVLSGWGKGMKASLMSNFEGFATNTTIIFSNTTTRPYKGLKEGRYWSMTTRDVERLKMMIPELDVVTPSISMWGQTAVRGVNNTNVNVKGIYANWSKVEEPRLKYGRYINEQDCIQERKVCVIGERVYNDLFPQGGDPCGSFVKIGSVYYQIIGMDISSGNINLNGRASEAAYIPLPVAQKIYHQGNTVHIIAMTGRGGVRMSTLEPRIRSVMAREHMFDSDDKQALFVMHMEQIFQLMNNLMTGITFLILLVGIGTILAGAIGVSNIMMVTVRERTTEIGIRRAIGATPVQILSQIIMESITLTLVSGSGGIVLSVGLLEMLTKVLANTDIGGHSFQIGFWLAIAAAVGLAILGVAAGLAPALRAMRIKPVDAMRDE